MKPRERWCSALVLVLALTGSSPEAAPKERSGSEAATATATLEWEPGRIGPAKAMFAPLRPELPKGLAPLPNVKDPRYACIRWGDGRGLSLAIDLAPGHERLWIDLDLDGDLSDEARTTWFAQGMEGVRTETVRVTYEGEGGEAFVPVRFLRAAAWDADRVRVLPWTHRRGEIVLGGRVRALALVDDNADLRFDDPDRDHLYLDVDGDGRFATAADGHERIVLGQPFRVGAEGWKASVPAPSGRTVVFERVETAPRAAPRRWVRSTGSKAGAKKTPPSEPFAELSRQVEAEREGTYAERQATLQKLGRLGTPEAFDFLLDLARHETNAGVAAAAARALGNPAYLERGGEKVRELTKSAFLPPAVAAGLLQALHEMGDPDREPLYRLMLGGTAPVVVGAAARYLACLGTEKAAKEVRAEWERRASQAGFRYQVYLALRALPEGPPRSAMVEAAEAQHASLAMYGLRDLIAMAHPRARELALLAAGREPLPESLAKAVAKVLGRLGDEESVEALLALAGRSSAAVELHVEKQLAPLRNRPAVAALVAALKSKIPRIRTVAAHALSGVSERGVTDALMARVKRERDSEALAAILEALGDHGDARCIDLLLGRAKVKKSGVRHAAIRALARVGLEDRRVRSFFVGLLDARRWEDRILAIDAAAASEDPRLCSKILRSLDHERRQVRIAAAEAVARLRCKEAIQALIDRLKREEEVLVVDAVARGLYRITGINLYDDARVWREWWKKEGKTFRLPETVPELPPRDAGGTRAGFYGIPILSGRVVFVIDQSGSMSTRDARGEITGVAGGNRFEVAIREVQRAIDGMRKTDFANVILFHSTVHPWRDQLERLTSENRHDLASHLKGKKPAGGTNLYDGLERGLLDPEVDTLFLLSDGVPGVGRYVSRDDILRAVTRLNQTRRVAIHTVSIGRDTDLLRRLAEQNGGQYVRR